MLAMVFALALVFAPAADAQEPLELNAGCTTTVTWDASGADTVASVDVLLTTSTGDTLVLFGTDNDGEDSLDVPCIDADTLLANLQVIAAIDTPYVISDVDVVITSSAPTIQTSSQGGAVDENCEFIVPFNASFADDCGVTEDSVMVSVELLTGNATLGDVSLEYETTEAGVDAIGEVPVSALTGGPALIAISWTAKDNCGLVATAADTVEVVDDTPPAVTCPADVVVECSGHGGTPADDPQLAEFFAGFSAQDNCDPDPVLDNDAPDFFELGVTVVTFSAVDASGNLAECKANVEVVDTTPPEITLELNRSALWPPNHKFHDIAATVSVTDICDPEPTFVLDTIDSNEEANGQGDGNTNPDVHGADLGSADVEFELRAERSGKGDGRVYTVIYTASDCSGNTASDTATVIVPHDQRGKARASNGYDKIGTGFDEASGQVALIVPSDDGFDATSIRLRGAQIGNIKGVVSPEEIYRGDVNADGFEDIVLVYPKSTAQELHLKAQGHAAKTSLHYADWNNNHHVVYNIFELGAPIAVDLNALELVTFDEEDDAEDDGGDDAGEENGEDDSDDAGDESGDDFEEGEAKIVTPQLSTRPNPFNPTTTVFYALPIEGNVTVRVYDIKGRLVSTLVDRSQPAGEHSIVWDGRDSSGQPVASGVYFLRLEAPGFGITKKAVMLK